MQVGALTAIFRDLTSGLANHSEVSAPGVLKLLAAVLYASTSLFIVFANKMLFQLWGFPSFTFLALAQYVTTALVLYFRKRSQVRAYNALVIATLASSQQQQQYGGGSAAAALPAARGGRRTAAGRGAALRTPAPHTLVSLGANVNPNNTAALTAAAAAAGVSVPPVPTWLYPDITWNSLKAVMPLPLLFFANTVSGLGATKNLNVPMFVLLRRFSIIMTMGFEMYLLARRPNRTVQFSVMLMVLSALIAAYGDLEMNITGYWLILLNDVFTALQGVVLRSKLDEGQKRRDAQPKRTSPNTGKDGDQQSASTAATVPTGGGGGGTLTGTTRQAILHAAAGNGQPIVISGPSMPLPPVSNGDSTSVQVPASDSDSSGPSTPRAAPAPIARGGKAVESPSATAQWTPTTTIVAQAQAASLVRQQALSADSLMFYNALCSIPLALGLFLSQRSEVSAMMAYHEWYKPAFLLCFASSMFLGFALNYSYFLCTKVNSPLTTTVIGSMKNVLSTYIGMLTGYEFHLVNFLGINLSVVATLMYSYDEIRKVRERYMMAASQAATTGAAAAGTTTTAV